MDATRCTEIVIGYEAFKNAFGVKKVLVRNWERAGAPIVRDEMQRPMTEKYELWCWLKSRKIKTPSTPQLDPQ